MIDEPTDARRDAGARTRARLLAAARHLLAATDGGDVTLRAITSAADANVAAVSYHFGSKDQLCQAVIDQALREVIDAQLERYGRLGDDATLEDLARAFIAPVIAGLTTGDADGRALLRIVARAAAGGYAPSQAAEIARGTVELARRLRVLLPGLQDADLEVRVEAVGALVRTYADGPLAAVLAGRSVDEVERLLLPVITGVWTGGTVARRPPPRRRTSTPRRA